MVRERADCGVNHTARVGERSEAAAGQTRDGASPGRIYPRRSRIRMAWGRERLSLCLLLVEACMHDYTTCERTF